VDITSGNNINSRDDQQVSPYSKLTESPIKKLCFINTATMSWSTALYPNIRPYLEYTATLLQNGLIIYIGGHEGWSSGVINFIKSFKKEINMFI